MLKTPEVQAKVLMFPEGGRGVGMSRIYKSEAIVYDLHPRTNANRIAEVVKLNRHGPLTSKQETELGKLRDEGRRLAERAQLKRIYHPRLSEYERTILKAKQYRGETLEQLAKDVFVFRNRDLAKNRAHMAFLNDTEDKVYLIDLITKSEATLIEAANSFDWRKRTSFEDYARETIDKRLKALTTSQNLSEPEIAPVISFTPDRRRTAKAR